jgi:hypothetical protein
MVYLAALLIFSAITSATWFVGVAVYRAAVGEPDPARNPHFARFSAGTIALVTLLCFVPNPWGFALSVGVWWLAAKQFLELPTPKAVALFLILGALSVVSRLAVLGAMEMF